MVSYQRWTSVAFEVAKSEGAQFENINDGAAVVEVASAVWNDRKSELKTATVAEARNIARQEISVT